jgi:hypothetical protein
MASVTPSSVLAQNLDRLLALKGIGCKEAAEAIGVPSLQVAPKGRISGLGKTRSTERCPPPEGNHFLRIAKNRRPLATLPRRVAACTWATGITPVRMQSCASWRPRGVDCPGYGGTCGRSSSPQSVGIPKNPRRSITGSRNCTVPSVGSNSSPVVRFQGGTPWAMGSTEVTSVRCSSEREAASRQRVGRDRSSDEGRPFTFFTL